MHSLSVIISVLVVTACIVSARPTFDVLYKIAREIEQDLVSDSHEHRRDSYRPQRPEYGPGVGYYPPSAHGRPPNYVHPATYPKPYPSSYPSPYPEPYPTPYPDQYPPQRPYHPPNHISDPHFSYDKGYQDQYASDKYGVVAGSNSYSYGGNYGYKQRGY